MYRERPFRREDMATTLKYTHATKDDFKEASEKRLI